MKTNQAQKEQLGVSTTPVSAAQVGSLESRCKGLLFVPPSAHKAITGSIKKLEEESIKNTSPLSSFPGLPRWKDILGDQPKLSNEQNSVSSISN